jgi:hypothetical protein
MPENTASCGNNIGLSLSQSYSDLHQRTIPFYIVKDKFKALDSIYMKIHRFEYAFFDTIGRSDANYRSFQTCLSETDKAYLNSIERWNMYGTLNRFEDY